MCARRSGQGSDPCLPPVVVVSPPDEPGEGEHKIYQYIRDHPAEHADACTVIYGLDADLIMLTLNHLHVAPNMHLYRESPEFARSLDSSLDPNSAYLLDIPAFGEALSLDLGGRGGGKRMVVSDYIFLCFLLGNDFLPHFPALNIRHAGHRSAHGGLRGRGGADTPHARQWLRRELARSPEASRAPGGARARVHSGGVRGANKAGSEGRGPQGTIDEELNAIPLRKRQDEAYIAPETERWQERYYRSLFGTEPTDSRIREICLNYLEGLEWTLRYYTTGCPDWRWTYKYDYPPLLEDLVRFVPTLGTQFLADKPPAPCAGILVQLAYVLPAPSLALLPEGLRHALLQQHPEWYDPERELRTTFCKYLWEAHPQLEHIDIEELMDIVANAVGPELK